MKKFFKYLFSKKNCSEFNNSFNNVGFFNPREIMPYLTTKMAFGMIEAYSPEQVHKSLLSAKGTGFKVMIDFSPLLVRSVDTIDLKCHYIDSTSKSWIKKLPPLKKQKLRRFPDDETLINIIKPYIKIIKEQKVNIGTIFLADEPYINGISKSEMERAANIIRSVFIDSGLKEIKFGVIFASGMFDAGFAQHIDRASGDYVRSIDAYYERGLDIKNKSLSDPQFDISDFEDWASFIEQNRLTTYDAAGNMYTGGGIPRGFDVVAFDFYLSTILFDGVHENSLSWLAERSPCACGQFFGQKMSSIRRSLSFIQDYPTSKEQSDQISDRKILDEIFTCRMTGILELLRNNLRGTDVQLMMISESSSNGVMEFYSSGRMKEEQPKSIIERRVLDEVIRGIDFYEQHKSEFQCGLMFFLFDDAFDSSINLDIYGASSLPSVKSKIFSFAAKLPSPSDKT